MVAQWTKPLPEYKYCAELQESADRTLRPHNRPSPTPLEGEQSDQYDRPPHIRLKRERVATTTIVVIEVHKRLAQSSGIDGATNRRFLGGGLT